ncbi:uncharacterized protein LOC131151411 [Malania oleifera]|uniref:uncharacterized protein LOC131151411 n=1 Tax=Malania oleifera TaxID=397392 RepID=UPI0025AEB81B|nr:uncharacterized protein LOC131151411 [Malania oleifera]
MASPIITVTTQHLHGISHHHRHHFRPPPAHRHLQSPQPTVIPAAVTSNPQNPFQSTSIHQAHQQPIPPSATAAAATILELHSNNGDSFQLRPSPVLTTDHPTASATLSGDHSSTSPSRGCLRPSHKQTKPPSATTPISGPLCKPHCM